MLRMQEGGITWEREDVRMMARILGSEFAVISSKRDYGWAPPVMSILKLAHKHGLPMSPKAERALDKAIDHVKYVKRLKSREDGKIPDKHASKFFRHQRADLAMLYKIRPSGVLLASEAGVGKTLPAIRWAEECRARRNMLIVPNPAKEQWAAEIERWGDGKLPVTIIDGTVRHQVAQITAVKRGWCIGHWESLVHARAGWLAKPWDIAIVDELDRMQNRNAQRTQTLHKIKSQWRMAIGAHPYANGVEELFSVLKFLYPDLYPSFWRWAHMHIEIDEGVFGGLDLRTPRRPKLLQWEIEPFTIRRMWKDVWKNLPPITRVQVTAHLSPKAQREYDQLRKKFFAEIRTHGGEKKILAIPSVLARCTRMRQYLVDPGMLGTKRKKQKRQFLGASQPSVKYPIVHDLIKDLRGRPPVIFTMWRESAMRLKQYLEGKKLRIGLVVGGMTSKKVNRVKWNFLKGKYDAVIIMIKVGGTSLNFGKYGTIIYLDHPWNQRDVEQTEGRVRRPEEGTGKIVPATSYHIIVANSYEENMLATRTDKHKDFAKVFPVAKAIRREMEIAT